MPTILAGSSSTQRSEAVEAVASVEADASLVTRRTRQFPAALMIAIVIAVVLEATVFRHGYLLADRSTIAIVHKAARLESGASDDVLLLGPSTAMVMDARALEESVHRRYSIYNYAIPNLGTTIQYHLILKKYLDRHPAPKLIVLSLPPDYPYEEEKSDDIVQEGFELRRFRRFFGLRFVMANLPQFRDWSFVSETLNNAIPSFDYRAFIKNGTLMPEPGEVWDWGGAQSLQMLVRRNEDILQRLKTTNGQLVYNGAHVVAPSEVLASLPNPPDAQSRAGHNLEMFVRLADSRGIRTVLLFTPVCCEKDEALSLRGNWRYLNDLVQQFASAYPMFAYHRWPVTSYSIEYFGDPSHMNERGAERFNAEFRREFPAILAGARLR